MPTLVSRFTPHGSWKRVEHDADGRGSFAVVERSMSDRRPGLEVSALPSRS
jgi:hypothetical protein